MTGKTRNPGGQPTPDETPQPKQQMQDDGSANFGEGGDEGEGEDDTGTTFANINPSGVNP